MDFFEKAWYDDAMILNKILTPFRENRKEPPPMANVLKEYFQICLSQTVLYCRAISKWLLLASVTGVSCGLLGTLFHITVEKVTELRALQPLDELAEAGGGAGGPSNSSGMSAVFRFFMVLKVQVTPNITYLVRSL